MTSEQILKALFEGETVESIMTAFGLDKDLVEYLFSIL